MADSDWGARFHGLLPAEDSINEVLSNQHIAAQPEVVTLQLLRELSPLPDDAPDGEAPPSLANPNWRVYAKIDFRCGAVSATLYCDWDGQVSLPANAVTASFVVARLADVNDFNPPPYKLTFQAMIARGGSAANRLTWTSVGSYLTADQYTLDDVPRFARRLFPILLRDVLSAPIAAVDSDLAELTLTLEDAAGSIVASYPITSDLLLAGIPIAAGAARVRIAASSAAATFQVTQHFQLGL